MGGVGNPLETMWSPAILLSSQVFSCKYCKIFKKNYFEEHLRTAASEFKIYKSKMKFEKAGVPWKRHHQIFTKTHRKIPVMEPIF